MDIGQERLLAALLIAKTLLAANDDSEMIVKMTIK